MSLTIPEKVDIENFTIEDNVLKGIEINFEENIYVGDAILKALDSDPDHVAQIDAETDSKTTFAEMKDRSIRCALWMREYGIKSGDVIVVCSHNHLDVYIPVFAIFYVGATFNGWDHEISLKSARELMKLIQPKLIFACESVIDLLVEAAKLEKINTNIIVFGSYLNIRSLHDILLCKLEDKIRNFRSTQNPDDIAFILLTSGSTGIPKGVAHSYGNFLKLVQTYTIYPLNGIVLCIPSVYWLTGFMLMFISTFTRATRIIINSRHIDDRCKVIEKYKVERMFMSPVMINYFCKKGIFDKNNFQSVNHILTGGAKTNRKTLEEFQRHFAKASVIPTYGLTETGRMVTSQTENTKDIGSVGFVASNTQLKIVDVDSKIILGPNQEGEIFVKQPTLMIGYYKNPDETKKVIDKDGWFHTGDIGFFNDCGEITITGRLKDVIKCGNFPISPTELEEVLLSHPSVMEVAVVPVPHEIDIERPMAFIKKCADVLEDELIALTLNVLGENKKLSGGVQFINELPKTPSGKIDRRTLKDIAKTLQLIR